MIGPVLGVLLATTWSTPWALFACELDLGRSAASSSGSINPAARPQRRRPARPRAQRADLAVARRHRGPRRLRVTATVVLTGTDVGIVAALRQMHHQPGSAWVLAVWGLGSAIGGVVYGAMHRTVPAFVLLALLVGTHHPGGARREPVTLAVLLSSPGVCCAPTITADRRLAVPRGARSRCAARRWGGTRRRSPPGSAVGAPIAGVAIDHGRLARRVRGCPARSAWPWPPSGSPRHAAAARTAMRLARAIAANAERDARRRIAAAVALCDACGAP